MAHSLTRKESIRELRYIKISFILIDMAICILYYYMFYSLPSSFLWISRTASYTSYTSIEMNRYFQFMKIIPYLTILFIIILWYNLYRYDRAVRSLKNEEYVFSSILASSEISTRVFSHYVKNELLGIVTQSESMMKNPEKDMNGLLMLRHSCMEVYERLNLLQKHSGRIVLNRSLKNLHEILGKTIAENQVMLTAQGIDLLYDPDPGPVKVFCDSHYLGEVFQNLILNAAEAMNASPSCSKKLSIETVLIDSQIKIIIHDTGPGIAPAVLGRIFEPFVSTKSAKYNWGIGLSFVKRIITSHNGKIEVQNKPEGGTIFTIFLPASK